MNTLHGNKVLDKKWKNNHSRRGNRCGTLSFGSYFQYELTDNIPAKVRRHRKNVEVRHYWNEWIDAYDELDSDDDLSFESDPNTDADFPFSHSAADDDKERIHNVLDFAINTRQKRLTRTGSRSRRTHLQRSASMDFATYWEDMQLHQRSLQKTAKRFLTARTAALRSLAGRKPLNFKLLFVADSISSRDFKRHGIDANEVLFCTFIRVPCQMAYTWGYHPSRYRSHGVRILVEQDWSVFTSAWRNVHKVKWVTRLMPDNTSVEASKTWTTAVEAWRRENIPDVQSFILQKVYALPGFEYLKRSSLAGKIDELVPRSKWRASIRMNIKLDRFAGVAEESYTRDLIVNEQFCV